MGLTTTIEGELKPGEKLLWSGAPKQGLILRSKDRFWIPFSVVWCSGTILWEVVLVTTGVHWLFGLFGVPFVAIGFYFLVGRFFLDAKKRKNTFYGLTDRRVVIISKGSTTKRSSIPLAALQNVSLTEFGSEGTVAFGRSDPFSLQLEGIQWPGYNPLPSFQLIQDANHVYNQVLEARERCQAR